MKKLVFLVGLFVLVLFLDGCKQQQQIVSVSEPAPVAQAQQVSRPIVWKQMYYKDLKLGDKVLFYNSTEIKLSGSFFNQTLSIENGAINVIDSINNVLKTVPTLTAGGLIDLKKSSSKTIEVMFISFSKNDITYKFSFFRKPDGSFTLNGNATLVFSGKNYPITAKADSECLLLFVLNKQEVVKDIIESADGWNIEGN